MNNTSAISSSSTAIWHDNTAPVRQSMQTGVVVNPASGHGTPPLFLAALNGDENAIRALLDAGASIERRQEDGRTALMQARIMCHEAAAHALCLAGAKDYPVFAQAAKGQAETGSPRAQTDIPMLTLAAQAGDAQLVADLLACGADVNQSTCMDDDCETTALLLAGLNGHIEVIPLLLAAGALAEPPVKPPQSALYNAVAGGHIEAVNMLLPVVVDIDKAYGDFSNPLIQAARLGYCDIAECLLRAGASVNLSNRHGWRPLEAAAIFGHSTMAKLLMQYGAEVECSSLEGKSPLLHAAERGHAATVKVLLEGGANPAHKDRNDMTALDHALKSGSDAVANLLRSVQ
ncbi:MAG: hypothetical protein EOP02_00815 [Proteobacteria bacterium]|nr:MAG: hypothetical protein EOP02_00815 [Pseudomonadota bacterium]